MFPRRSPTSRVVCECSNRPATRRPRCRSSARVRLPTRKPRPTRGSIRASRCSGSIGSTKPSWRLPRWRRRQFAGYLPETAALRQAEVREARGDYPGAEAIYESLVQRKLAAPQSAWLRLGMMAEMNGHRDRAREAFRYVLETFPLTQEGNEAELGLDRVDGFDLSYAGRGREGA